MAIYWGPDLCLLYNDAWRLVVGDKHPWSMGRPGLEVWPEIWKTIAPLFGSVLSTGEATWRSDELLPMQRFGYTEECYFDYTFNPIRGEEGKICGILNIVQETTYRVLNDRRIRFLRELAHQSASSTSDQDACRKTLSAMATDRADLPFAGLYLINSDQKYAHLVDATGLPDDNPAKIPRIDLTSDLDECGWPLASALRSKKGILVENLTQRFGDVPGSFWPEPTLRSVKQPMDWMPFNWLIAYGPT